MYEVILAGTNGEAVTLSASEKSELVSATRRLATELGQPELTVVLGCGGQCTRDVIEETRLAKSAGADFALVLVPSYFHFAMNEEAVLAFSKRYLALKYNMYATLVDKQLSSLTPAQFRF
jgi:4-hydroxy-2-oxoglutarate aldolase